MVDLKLPYWLGGELFQKLKAIVQAFWILVESWLRFPLSGFDIDNLDEERLLLLGWERDIIRFDGEPLSLYRKRVKFAYVNAFDSGSVVGFKNIMRRLDVGMVEIKERLPGLDWDIVSIELDDQQFGSNQKLVELVVQYYGRTCRRYQITINNSFLVNTTCSTWQDDHVNFEAIA